MSPWFTSSEFSIFRSSQLGPMPLSYPTSGSDLFRSILSIKEEAAKGSCKIKTTAAETTAAKNWGKNAWWKKSDLFWTFVKCSMKITVFWLHIQKYHHILNAQGLQKLMKPHPLTPSAQSSQFGRGVSPFESLDQRFVETRLPFGFSVLIPWLQRTVPRVSSYLKDHHLLCKKLTLRWLNPRTIFNRHILNWIATDWTR